VRSSDPPAELQTFRAGDWPGATASERHAAWCEARQGWAEVNGWPGGPDGWAGAQVEAATVTPDEPWRPDEV
jgi:hypothetical protein